MSEEKMTIIVKLGEPFWRQVGQRTLPLELPLGASVQDALARLQAEYPELEAGLRGEGLGRLTGLPVAMFVEDRMVRPEDASEVALEAGQRLYLLVPVAGG
jgi:sulfur carrier protein ThiS